MSTTQHHNGYSFKAAPATELRNTPQFNSLIDVIENIEDDAMHDQAIKVATQAVQQFVQQRTAEAKAGYTTTVMTDTGPNSARVTDNRKKKKLQNPTLPGARVVHKTAGWSPFEGVAETLADPAFYIAQGLVRNGGQ